MAVLQRSTSWFVAFQIALTAAALSAITAWLNGQPRVHDQTSALLDPRSLQAYGIGLGLLCAAWSLARIGLQRTGSAQAFLDCDAAAVDRCTFYGLSIGSFALADWNLLPGAIDELSTGGPVVPGSLRTFAFGPLAWSLVSAQAFALLLALWHRWRTKEMACCILLLVTAAMWAAGPFAGSLAAASALRWSLAVAYLFGSALIWLRAPLARTAQKLSCRCKLNDRDLQIAQSLLQALCAAPVLLITG